MGKSTDHGPGQPALCYPAWEGQMNKIISRYLSAFNCSDFDSVSCSIYCCIWVELQQSSLKAEEFINASEGTTWPFSKQNRAMKAKKITCFLENVALKMRVAIPAESCRSRTLSSQKPEDGKVQLYHPAAGSTCISIALLIAGRRWNLLSTANWLLPMELHVMSLVLLFWNLLTTKKRWGTEKNA